MTDIELLIKKYYESGEVTSAETSSHWQKYSQSFQVNRVESGKQQRDKKKSSLSSEVSGLDNYEIKGVGFGNFKRLTFLNSIFELPISIYLVIVLWRKLKRNTFKKTWRYTKNTGQIFGYDMTRMALTVDFLQREIGNLDGKTFCLIGDGYGRLGSLLKEVYPNSRIIYINLGKTLLFDYIYSLKAHPSSQHLLKRVDGEPFADFTYIEAESYRKWKIEANIFINIASMQEMNFEAIFDYFSLIKSQPSGTYFYCANRISKTLPDGSVIEFHEYPWKGLEILKDELCPWYQKFPSLRPPFIRKFDGPIQHRLTCVVK